VASDDESGTAQAPLQLPGGAWRHADLTGIFLSRSRRHSEGHLTGRIGWLRAAVLGANDGIVSTASLILGVAAAHAGHANILIAGTAGLVAGAMSMAAGEYVSVHSQADVESTELERERRELHTDSEGEHKELAAIYVGRGLDHALATQVAVQLMAHDALGITDTMRARPLQAALASALSFSVGAALPILVVAIAPAPMLIGSVFFSSLVFLIVLGATAARVGGASVLVGALRIGFWGALAMVITAGVGALIGHAG
jgi:VIT1/CCC1 family predicted Fe2+/Mn2+ transporter